MYVYAKDACHGHVTLSKVRESYNFATPQRLHLLPSRKILCSRVARGPEAKRRKNQAHFLNGLVGGLSFGLGVFPGTCERCRPSLNASIDPASKSGKEC